MIYIIMGASGCGKSTVGQAIAKHFSIPFHDGDDFHPKANKQKMAAGEALNDEDRRPWLNELATKMRGWNDQGNAVLACSALKENYRQALSGASPADVRFIYLRGQRETLAKRLAQRSDHFFDPNLLDSQLETLDEPSDAITLDIECPLNELIEAAILAIQTEQA